MTRLGRGGEALGGLTLGSGSWIFHNPLKIPTKLALFYPHDCVFNKWKSLFFPSPVSLFLPPPFSPPPRFIAECLKHFLYVWQWFFLMGNVYYSAKPELGGHISWLVCEFFSRRAPFLWVRRRSPRSVIANLVLCMVSCWVIAEKPLSTKYDVGNDQEQEFYLMPKCWVTTDGPRTSRTWGGYLRAGRNLNFFELTVWDLDVPQWCWESCDIIMWYSKNRSSMNRLCYYMY